VQHLLPGLPKPLAQAAGRPFLEWVVRHLSRQGIGRIVLSTGYLGDKIEKFAATLKISGVSIMCVREGEALGTAGGFLHALRSSGTDEGEVLACNGDSLVLAELAPVYAALDDSTVDGALVAVRLSDSSRYGTLQIDDNGMLVGFAEKRPGAGYINAGLYFFRRGTIAHLPERKPLSFEYDVFPSLLAAGARIQVIATDAPFLDIGTEPSLAQADAFIRDNMKWFE
jgi:D-glycero-alpha-D-manno-heptose 1-phosphate guanylyltransferase